MIRIMATGVLAPEDDPATFFSLDGGEIAAMSEYDALTVVLIAERMIARARAIKAHGLARFNEFSDDEWSTIHELALATASSSRRAENELDLAEQLAARLPATLAAMRRGELDAYKAGKIADATEELSLEQARWVDGQIAATLAGKDPTSIQRKARRLALKAEPAIVQKRAQTKRAKRRLEKWNDQDGMAHLEAHLPAETVSAIYGRIDAIAQQVNSADDPCPMDAVRADVFTDLLLGKLAGAAPQVQVHVTVPITALLGTDDQIAELAGYGPIPAGIAREIAANPHSTWRRLLTDPLTGQLLEVGRRRYRPPAALADYVRARDQECVLPGCHRPAHACDLDHRQPWRHGGATTEGNLDDLCRRHHHLKDTPGWTFERAPGGTLRITTPLGRVYTSMPEPIAEPESERPSTPDTSLGRGL
ncbi:MAG: DUF222 domain-containing protein [Pseudonocardiaceae bacterium]|nr:DUF222 domain-containing protein [Pseudonocardiaceae bacterium]